MGNFALAKCSPRSKRPECKVGESEEQTCLKQYLPCGRSSGGRLTTQSDSPSIPACIRIVPSTRSPIGVSQTRMSSQIMRF